MPEKNCTTRCNNGPNFGSDGERRRTGNGRRRLLLAMSVHAVVRSAVVADVSPANLNDAAGTASFTEEKLRDRRTASILFLF